MADIQTLSGDWLDDRFEEEVETFSWQELYPTLARKPLRLSHSTLDTIHNCERKFQLLKLKNIQDAHYIDIDGAKKEVILNLDGKHNNVNLDYGSAFGIGIQTYIITNNLEQAIWEAIRSYNYAEETKNKNAIGLVAAIQAFAAQWDNSMWEVAYYNGKPAAELSFKIILDKETQDYYCGYIDLVLKNKLDNTVVVIEIKTTGIKIEDISPLYRNSGQALGYSILLDSIIKEEQIAAWTVLYLINQLKGQNILPKIHLLPFEKTLKDRLSWLLNLKLDHEYLLKLVEIDHWPMRGKSCFAYNRPCPLYGICDLTTLDTKEAKIKKEEEWDFVFTLEELIARAI